MTYNFKDTISGNTYKNSVQFTMQRRVNSVTSAINLTGSSITMEVKNAVNLRLVKTYSLGSGLTIINGANGIFKFDEQVIDIYPGNYVYEITFTLSDGTVGTYITGNWVITEL
jgi:hypothetical protein